MLIGLISSFRALESRSLIFSATKRTQNASTVGTHSLYINNYNADAHATLGSTDVSGAKDEFISPHIFTLFGSGHTLTFDYAFAARASNNADQLRVYASDDCGQTWTSRRLFVGGILRTAPDVPNTPFIPSSTQWRSGFVPMSSYDGGDPILIKFEFSNGGGNNLYIDNINLSAANVSLEEIPFGQLISLYPNPSRGELNIDFGGTTQKDVTLEVFDLYGRKLLERTIKRGVSDYRVDEIKEFTTGVYLVNLTQNGEIFSERIVLEK